MEKNEPDILKIIETAEDFPALPGNVVKLFKMASDPDVSLYAVSKIIESDASMSARVLKIVNSAMYKFKSPVTNIKQAVSILGIKSLRNIAFTLAMADLFPKKHADQYSDLFKRSLCAAVATDLIAELKNCRWSSEAFLGALLQNIGMFIFMRYMGDSYLDIIKEAREKGLELPYVEKQHIKILNSQAGTIVAERWNMPKTVVMAIKYQNNLRLVYKKNFPDPYREIIEYSYLGGLAADVFCSWNKQYKINLYRQFFRRIVENDVTMANDILASIPHLLTDLAGNIGNGVDQIPDYMGAIHESELELIRYQTEYSKLYSNFMDLKNEPD